MLHKTRGIVLHTINYAETSVVAKVYTELYGLQSYLINGVRNKKAKFKANLLQPLSLLDMIVYHKERNGLQRVSELRPIVPLNTIPYDITKSSIALFLNEILYKAIREEEVNLNLFDFIFNSTCILDLQTKDLKNFHLLFMMQLSKYLGFFPLGKYTDSTPYFNLKEGLFQALKPHHSFYLDAPLSQFIYTLMLGSYQTLNEIALSKTQRKELLQKIIHYFELHLTGFSDIKSHLVLEEVMS